ncbi:MAG: inositol monophosphatase, partial [Holosporales bacterium]|nr:inositol monophosphatase [Holosporales bacterium]
MNTSAILHIMTKAAEKAAFGLIRDFGELEKLQISRKGFKNFVTSADRNSECKIMKELSKARPDFSFLCEESGFTSGQNNSLTWVVDPIDGTTNFMRGIPYFAINIALMNREEVVAGVTFDPIRGDYFVAETGLGAFVSHRNRLRVSMRENLEEAVIATRVPLDLDIKISNLGAFVRKTGSLALDLAYLSAGKYDAVISSDAYLWDIASGIILVKESGGFLEYVKKSCGKYDIIAASSTKIMKCLNG